MLTAAAADGLLEAAYDLSEGGLAVALAECCLDEGLGAQVTLQGDPFTQPFSGRRRAPSSRSAPAPSGLSPRWPTGTACPSRNSGWPGDSLVVHGSFDIPVDELAAAHTGTLPALFG